MKAGLQGRADRMMTWLAAALLCVLAGHAPAQGVAADQEALVALSNTQLTGDIPSSFSNPGMSSALFVPVILTASGLNNSYYTSELTLTNRGSGTATLRYTYTAAAGGRRGTASETLAPGRQKIVPDAVGYLKNLGIPIPDTGNRIGTLRVEVSESAEVGVTVRTTTRVAEGRAGLAYPGIAAAAGFEEAVYLCGLRQNGQDRSNVAFQHMGTPEDGPITLRATVFSGDPDISERHVLEERILVPGGFHQYNAILNLAGFDNGYVKVERVGGTAPFYAYGVINDQANSDGSFVFPVTASSLAGARGQTLPVIIEHPNFSSELMVTNFSSSAKVIDFRFVANAIGRADRTAGFSLSLEAGEQRIIPEIVEYLRRQGVAGVGPAGRTLAGAVFATARRGDLSGVVIGARTGSPGGGGQYSVFYNAVPYGAAFSHTAWIDALRQNQENRSNLALVNTGEMDDSESVFQLEIYDGERGRLVETVPRIQVPARGWHQINAVLGKYAPGTTQGYVRIRKMSGNNPFLAYGVVNDGGAPGQRSGDGAYLPARETIIDSGTEGMTDREVLEALYHATGGPDWINRTDWLSDAPLSEWFGVVTDGSGRVTRLTLPGNQLSGAIPPELAGLTDLQELDLNGNQLSGAIPKKLQQLSELTSLNIGRTDVCVPADATFQAWLDTLSRFRSSGLVCDGTRRVLFSASNYAMREGESITVTVRLIDQTGDPLRSLAIFLTAMPAGGATAADYSGVPESITIMAPRSEASFVVTAVKDESFDDGESVVLGFRRPLPSGVTIGDPDTATVRIIDPGTEGMTDREVLEALYHATGGPDWINRTDWLSDAPLSEWFGVVTDGSGRVTRLTLPGNQLSGAIPPALGRLTQLQSLDLGQRWDSTSQKRISNQLSGAIPPALGRLTQLQSLDLGQRWDSTSQKWISNQLSGAIPPDLGQLTNLQSLSLSGNQLSGAIPPELAGLTNLQSLSLSGNQLSGAIPPELGGLTQLQWLYLGGNQLSGAIPPELGGLTQLQSLNLSGNQLSGAIPPELAGLTQLQSLYLGGNQLSGAIPPELGGLTQLQWLWLSGNQLSGAIPPELAGLTNLQSLSLSGNQLSGAIPPELAGLTQLQELNLWGNQLSGAIPKKLQQLSKLTSLDIGRTDVCVPADATFQAWLDTLSKFRSSGLVCDGTRRVLFSASNYAMREGESITVTVRLIDQTGNPLRSLAISLTAMPAGGATAADYSGVPESITIMDPRSEASFVVTAVKDESFDDGESIVLGFRRPLPSGVTAGDPDTATVTIIDPGTEGMTDREVLEALYHATGGPDWINRTNWLSDAPLSEWFGVVTDGGGRVTRLTLPGNQLSGAIPPALGRLTQLQSLDLGQRWDSTSQKRISNQLSGAIPPELAGLTQLQSLSLSGNQLSGAIPPELAGLTQLQSLSLGGNQLSGVIPRELGGLTQLQSLYLGGNQLSGAIPPALGRLTQLQSLDLGQRWDSTSQKWISNQLSGAIPPDLGQLTNLQSLSLSGNQLSGAIPPELAGLTNLQSLSLSGNQLSGAIPPELGGLTQLQWLYLGGNQLSGAIPPELGGLTQLQSLNLSGNQLSGAIPPELAGLTQLQSLYLGGNQLSGAIPPELGGLTQLQWLWLSGNQLSGAIPPELAGLTNLQSLSLSGNQLSGAIPPELAGLTQLQELNLWGNQLSGAIPKKLQQLSKLTSLDIGRTDVCVPADATFQAWLDTLSKFRSSGLVCDGTRRVLFSASNYAMREGESITVTVRLIDQIGDPLRSLAIFLTAMPAGGATAADYSGVPESITIMAPRSEASFVVTAVKDESFDDGESVVLGFRRPLPSGVTAGDPDTATVTIIDPGTEGMTDREVLEALYHATGGPDWINRTDWLSDAPLSEWFGVVTDGSGRVTRLTLPGNQLSGAIPPALGRLTQLQSLDLGQRWDSTSQKRISNQLSGAIPPELAGLTQLQSLSLSGNQLSGAIPPELAGLTQLQSLSLSGNQLSGAIPPELAGLTQLQELDLNGNQLSGAIPPELAGLTQLQRLELSGNQLSGAIPPELAGLTQLQSLSLSGNQLSGAIPPELAGLTQLQLLYLWGNQLSGVIPPELAGLTQLQRLELSGNQLSGAIPPELAGLTQLQWLWLSGNQLSGAIPPELAGLTQLQSLHLGGNQLSGAIPPELAGLTQLQSLYLGGNQLSGAIPPELAGLTQLQSLYLGGNQLSGAMPPELAGLTQLQRLWLSGNQLSGAIPPELAGLTQLQRLELSGNQLSGAIPPELAGLTQLQSLYLNFNLDLTGMIPPELQELPLSTLGLMATSVCVPKDAALQEWLATIDFTPSGLTCGSLAAALSSIDVLVVYTPAARRLVGGTTEMEAVIDLMTAETNQAYLDGGVNQQLVLVDREEVQYAEEDGSGFLALGRLRAPSDGYLDEVHAIRDRAGADLVHLIADVTDVGGIAILPGAFALTCAECDSRVFAHELGHNMGLSHDRYVSRSLSFPYSHGYVNQQAFTDGAPESAGWRTIMSYGKQCGDAGLSCDLIMRFSNPNQTYLGDPLGVPGEEWTAAVNGPADAVRTLNLTRQSVASFRTRSSGNQLTVSSTLSQARPMARIGGAVLPPAPGGSLFRAVAPNVGEAASRRSGGLADRATLRRREVSVDIQRLARLPAGGSTALRLNLFDDVVLTGIIERWTPTYSGGFALSGRLVGVPGGSVTLVVNGSVVAGTVRLPGATYRIRPAGAGRHAIMQVDPSQFLQECEVVSRTTGFDR